MSSERASHKSSKLYQYIDSRSGIKFVHAKDILGHAKHPANVLSLHIAYADLLKATGQPTNSSVRKRRNSSNFSEHLNVNNRTPGSKY